MYVSEAAMCLLVLFRDRAQRLCHVCMYVCMYVCEASMRPIMHVYVCTYVCMHVCVLFCTCMCAYVGELETFRVLFVYACTYDGTRCKVHIQCMYECTCVWLSIIMHAHMHAYTYMHIPSCSFVDSDSGNSISFSHSCFPCKSHMAISREMLPPTRYSVNRSWYMYACYLFVYIHTHYCMYICRSMSREMLPPTRCTVNRSWCMYACYTKYM